MDNKDLQERVRARAHLLWEQEGRPEGKAEEHWRRAASLVESEQDAGPAPANLALTEMAGESMAGESTDAPRPAKASSSPRKTATASKTGSDQPAKASQPAKPAAAPAATKGKRTPKPAP